MKKYKVVFADLDGTLIDTQSGATFSKGMWDMKFKLDVLDKLKILHPDYIVIVTNQGGIGKFISLEHFETKVTYVAESIQDYTGVTTHYHYCASMDKNNPYRKPNPGMLEIAYKYYKSEVDENITKEDMLMIGDASGKPGQFSDSDKKCAENFGIDYLDVIDFTVAHIDE